MGRARERGTAPLPPAGALARWTDADRWPAFVDGLARVTRVDADWPAPGSELAWESVPAGRGNVTERVEVHALPAAEPDAAARFATRVSDATLTGVQTATFRAEGEGTSIELELHYQLVRGGPLSGVTDIVFIRRAVSQSLARTLERFAADAAPAPPEPII